MADKDHHYGQLLVILTLSAFSLLFTNVTHHNTFKPGCWSIFLYPHRSFLLSGVYMLLTQSEKRGAGFVDDLRDGKHTGAPNAPSI